MTTDTYWRRLSSKWGNYRHAGLQIVVLCGLAFTTATAADKPYLLAKGDRSVCMPFLTQKKNIQYLRPVLENDDSKWEQYKTRCPDLLTKQGLVGGPRQFTDYALYHLDIENHGREVDVLYRRFDRDYYTTVQESGRQFRRYSGIESEEDFHIVDLESCLIEKAFAGIAGSDGAQPHAAKTRLIRLNGRAYIQHVNPVDIHKTMHIYEKKVGQPWSYETYQNPTCVFQRK